MLTYLSSFCSWMVYSETNLVIGCLAQIPVLIFKVNFIKDNFGIKNDKAFDTAVKEESV